MIGSLRRRTAASVTLMGRTLTVGAVMAAPWWFGAVQAGAQMWLFAAVAVASLGCLASQWLRPATERWLPLALLPLAGAMVLAAAQLVPLSPAALARISPGAAAWRAALAQESGADAAMTALLELPAASESYASSLYRASTRRDLSMLALGTAVFMLGALWFRTPAAQGWLLAAVAVNGAALALFGIVQQLTWNGMLYWRVPLTHGGGAFGPFVCRNNAAGYLNLCLAAAVGLTLWSVLQNGGWRTEDGGRKAELQCTPRLTTGWRGRLRRSAMDLFANLDALILTSASLGGAIIAGLLCSLSRGAAVAAVCAALLTVLAVAVAQRRAAALGWGAAVALAGLLLVGWVGRQDAVRARLATLVEPEILTNARLDHWQDSLRAVPDFWIVGSGLGTHRYIYRPYQRSPEVGWFYFAENEYVQALVEGGLPGLALLIATAAAVGLAAWTLLASGTGPAMLAVGVAGVFALASQAVHACFDFGLRIPANMLLLALLCGAVCGQAATLARSGRRAWLLALPAGRGATVAVLALLAVAVAWGAGQARAKAAVQRALAAARELPDIVQADAAPQLERTLARLEAATELRPDDAELHARLAEVRIARYSAEYVRRAKAENETELQAEQLRQLSTPAQVHSLMHDFARRGQTDELETLRGHDLATEWLQPALRDLVLARRACPLLADVHLRLGELTGLVVDPAADAMHFARARRLRPVDPQLWYRCGLLEFQAGRPEVAFAAWRHCLAISDQFLEPIRSLAGRYFTVQQFVNQVLPDSPEMLVRLARDSDAGPADRTVRALLVRRAGTLLDAAALPIAQRHYLRGSILALEEDFPAASDEFALAVELQPNQLAWRYEWAVTLFQLGRLDEAREQARWCARMAPRDRRYRNLLEQIYDAQF